MSDARNEKTQGDGAGKAASPKDARRIPTGPNLTDEEIDAMYNDPDLLEYVTKVYREEGERRSEERRKRRREERLDMEHNEKMREEMHKDALEAIDRDIDQQIKVNNFKKLERIFVAQTLFNSC